MSREPVELVPGAVIAVEPGLYWPRMHGIRIEETYVVTAPGASPLSAPAPAFLPRLDPPLH